MVRGRRWVLGAFELRPSAKVRQSVVFDQQAATREVRSVATGEICSTIEGKTYFRIKQLDLARGWFELRLLSSIGSGCPGPDLDFGLR